MTVICAYQEPGDAGSIWIGSDRQAKIGSTIIHADADKWAVARGVAVGVTGEWWVRAVIQDVLDQLEHVSRLPRQVDQALKAHGYTPEVKDGDGPWRDQGIIVASSRPGTERGIWYLEAGPCVFLPVPVGTFYALGIGMDFALGAAHALRGSSPQARMEAALKAAIRYSDGCGGEPWLHDLDQLA